MRVLVDTNVVLDVLLAREPFVHDAAAVFAMVERAEVEAFLCATTVTTVDYLLCRALPQADARAALRGLLRLFQIAAVNRPVLESALVSPISDFEDAVLAEAARQVEVECIVTRNTADFRQADLVALDPAELLDQHLGRTGGKRSGS